MCFYYNINKGNTDKLVKNKVITEKQALILPEIKFANGFEHPQMPIITNMQPDVIQDFTWGYLPGNIKGKDQIESFYKRYNTLNSRGENISDSNLFGEAFEKRRCIVLCSGFYEWQHVAIPGKAKTLKNKYYVTLSDDEMFVLGGIWNSFKEPSSGEIISTYSILTTDANPMMAEIHNTKKRMPFILEAEKVKEWLNPEQEYEKLIKMVKPFDQKYMKAVAAE